MKKTWLKMTAFVMLLGMLAPVAGKAQEDKKEQEKIVKEKEKERKDYQQVIITRTNNDEKVVVEINGDKVTVNGKPIEDLKKDGSDINVRVNKVKDMAFFNGVNGFTATDWKWNGGDNIKLFTEDANRAMLGVTTEKTEQGASVISITKESAAEKLGLKSGDVITKVDDKKIESPDDLTAAIKAHKPGDKVSVTYLRDKKEQKGSADLTAWKSHTLKSMDVADLKLNFDNVFPRTPTQPRVFSVPGQVYSRTGAPKLGLSVQDTDDGKGVKVIEVDEESNAAKAGLKKDDLITEVDGKAMNSTDEMVKMIRESKDKVSIMVKLQRGGKTQNIEVKIPRKIKTVDM